MIKITIKIWCEKNGQFRCTGMGEGVAENEEVEKTGKDIMNMCKKYLSKKNNSYKLDKKTKPYNFSKD